ncbi:MAG: hypothetical protein ABIH08_07765 [Candidatus Omnitrophota bacterium]
MRKILTFLLILGLILPCGCHSIRKKFTREKKYKKDTPVYVDFKDYSSAPTREDYMHYYLFIRGWLDELEEALRKGVSYKREKRSINEAIMNLEQIISFYNIEGKDIIYPFYEELIEIKKQIEKVPNMSETKSNLLSRKIESFKRRFERNFNYTDAQKWIN